MTAEPVIPLEELLQPLPGDVPCGRLLRPGGSMEPELRALRDAAAEARRNEKEARDRGENPALAGMSDWQTVKQDAVALLAEISKDVQAAGFLLEALVRTDGFAGLASGLKLVGGLVERFWDDMLERARQDAGEDADEASLVEDLSKHLSSLDQPLANYLGLIVLTSGSDAGEYALWEYEMACQTESKSEAEREALRAISVDQFNRSVAATAKREPQWFNLLWAQVSQCLAEALRVETLYEERLTGDLADFRPAFVKLRGRLEDVERCLEYTAKPYLATDEPEATGGTESNGSSAGHVANGSAHAAGDLRDREDAFRELNRIADFFARTEPLSLLAEQIRQVVHRGRLTPEKYYAELIDNEDSLKHFFRLVGIKANTESSEY